MSIRVVLAVLLLWPALPALAATPVGPDFQVNTATFGFQQNPSVAMADDGRFVVLWRDNQTLTPDMGVDDFRVKLQLYDAAGVPVGGEIEVDAPNNTNGMQIAGDPNGNFVVVWDEGPPFDVMARRYLADGSPIGSEFRVNSYTPGGQRGPSIAIDPTTGKFMVVWWSNASQTTGETDRSIQGQLFDADGSFNGGQFQVNTITGGDQEYAHVAANDGQFVVTWSSDIGSNEVNSAIQARRYDEFGPLADEFQANTNQVNVQLDASVAVDTNGDFVIVWHSLASNTGTDSDGTSVQAQRFDDSGAFLGAEFQVNAYTTGNQQYARVAYGKEGEFVVVWRSSNGDGTDPDSSMQSRRFDAQGVPIGSQFQVNSTTSMAQATEQFGARSIAARPNGEFVVVWQSETSSGNDDSAYSVQARRFLPVLPDRDGDGIVDDLDNCPDDPNPGQTNVCRGIEFEQDDLVVVNPQTRSLVLVQPDETIENQIVVTEAMPGGNAPLLGGTLQGVALDRTLGLYVAQDTNPKIVRVDGFTGEEDEVLFMGTSVAVAYDLAFRRSDRTIFLTDASPAKPATDQPIFSIPLGAGQSFPRGFGQRVTLSGVQVLAARGIDVVDDETLVVVDATLGVVQIALDPGDATGTATTVSSGGFFVEPDGIAVAADGVTLFVADRDAFGGSGGVIAVDRMSGAQSIVSSNASAGGTEDFADPSGISLDSSGNLFVTDGDRVLRVEREFGIRAAVTQGEALTSTAGITTVPMVVSDSFEAVALQEVAVPDVMTGAFPIKQEDKVVVSLKGPLADSTRIKTENDNQFWSLRSKQATEPVDLEAPVMVGDIPGEAAPGEETAGQFADLFRDGPVDLRDFTLSAKLRARLVATPSSARSALGGGPQRGQSADVEVSFEATDENGNSVETNPMQVGQDFSTESTEVNEEGMPMGEALEFDFSAIIALALNVRTGSPNESAEVDVDDVALVPEPGALLLQLAALAALSAVGRARRRDARPVRGR